VTPTSKKPTRTILVILGLGLAGLLIGVIPIRAGFIRAPIESAVRDATGLDFSVGGSIVVRLGLAPSISTGNLTLGDPAENPLLTVDSLNAKVGLFPLLSNKVHLKQLVAAGVQVDYCSPLPLFSAELSEDADAAANAEAASVVVDQIEIENISVGCGTATPKEDLQIHIRHFSASAPEHESMHLEADGGVRGIDISLTVTAGELKALLTGPDSFPLDLSLTSTSATMDVSGNVLTPLTSPAIEADFELNSSDLSSLSAAFGLDQPALKVLRAEGHIQADPDVVRVVDLIVELGENRVDADASVDLTTESPLVEVSATMQQLDLAPFMNQSIVAQSSRGQSNQANLDLRPVFDVLGAFDADIQLAVQKVTGLPLQLDNIEGNIHLRDGIVDLRSLTMESLGGTLSAEGEFNSVVACPELQLRARADEVDVATVNDVLVLDKPVGGRIGGVELKTTSCGNDLFEHRGSLQAELTLDHANVSLGGKPVPLVVEQLLAGISFRESTAVRLVGQLAGEAVIATFSSGSVEELMGQNAWPVELDLQGGGGRLQLKGRAGPLTDQFALDASVNFDAPQIGSLHEWTAGPADAMLPLRATSKLHIDERSVVADSIDINLGGSDLRGRLDWQYTQSQSLLAVTLRSDFLDLDDVAMALAAPATQPVSDVPGTDTPLNPADFRIPRVDVDIKLDSVNIYALDLQHVDISGRLRSGIIDNAKVSAVLEGDVELLGSLHLDLRSSPASGALDATANNVDIGRLFGKLGLVDDLNLRADAVGLSMTSTGATPRQFALNTALLADIKGFNWSIPPAAVAAGHESRESFQLSLAEVKLSAGPDRGTTWESHGEVGGFPAELRLELPSFTTVFGDDAELPMTLVAATGDNVAMIDARIDRSAEQGLFAKVVVSGEVIAGQDRELGAMRSPLADYEISSDVTLMEGELWLPNLHMRLGSSSVNGTFSLISGGDRRQSEVVLHAPYLQTDDLNYWGNNFGVTAEAARIEDEGPTSADDSDRGIFIILHDFISKFREKDDLKLSVIVDELHASTDRMGGAELNLYVDEDEFILKPLKISSSAGDVDAEYTWRKVDDRVDVGLKVHAKTLSYGGLLRLVKPKSEVRGVLYLDTDIRADAKWMPDVTGFDLLLNNANGNLDLAAWPENADAGLLDLWTGNLILALLPTSTAEQSNKLNCLASRLEVNDGVLETGTALMDSTTTIIRVRGEIDLAQRNLDLLAAPQAKRERFLSVSTPVTVTGTFDDFRIGVEPAGILGMAMKWWMSLVYVPFKWLTGERYPADGTATCFKAMDWELTPEAYDYLQKVRKEHTPN
jgi:uncharacterized protein involved in outer membrane biogenesis